MIFKYVNIYIFIKTFETYFWNYIFMNKIDVVF